MTNLITKFNGQLISNHPKFHDIVLVGGRIRYDTSDVLAERVFFFTLEDLEQDDRLRGLRFDWMIVTGPIPEDIMNVVVKPLLMASKI